MKVLAFKYKHESKKKKTSGGFYEKNCCQNTRLPIHGHKINFI